MKIMATDDEKGALYLLTETIAQVAPEAEIAAFQSPVEAIAHAKENDVDIAFLDIRMRGMTGLELAKTLKEIHPYINIVFCTGYAEYMAQAIGIHASGYIQKPVSTDQVERELQNLLYPIKTVYDEVYAKTFGNFDLLYRGEPVVFKLSKAKEMLAYLVDLQGDTANRKDIAAALFGDQPYDLKMQDYFSKIHRSLKNTLEELGVGDVLKKGRNSYYLDMEKLPCDAVEYAKGNPKAINAFHGEYMNQYSWAEESIGKFYK